MVSSELRNELDRLRVMVLGKIAAKKQFDVDEAMLWEMVWGGSDDRAIVEAFKDRRRDLRSTMSLIRLIRLFWR